MIATQRFAKLSGDKATTSGNQHRSGGLLQSLQATWGKLFPSHPKKTTGKVPTTAQSLASSAKKATPLPAPAATESKKTVSSTNTMVKKLAPTPKPKASNEPKAVSG